MKNKISKTILLGIASLSGVSLLAGNVFANFIVSSAPTIGVKITIAPLPTYEVTYYLPTSGSSDAYTSYVLEVQENDNLYDALADYTGSAINGYTFSSWHLDKGSDSFRTDGKDYAANLVASNFKVTEDIAVYGKYVQNNVGYYYDTTHRYVTSNQTNLTIAASSFYYGTRIYSVDGVEGSEVALTTSSGIYNLTKNANNWSVLRKITIGINGVSSWWPNGSKTFVYCATNDDSSTEWTSNLTFTSNKSTIYVDTKYTKFNVVRSPSSTPSGTFDGLWNQTVDVKLTEKDTGSQTYSSTYNTIYIQDNKDDSGKSHINWWS